MAQTESSAPPDNAPIGKQDKIFSTRRACGQTSKRQPARGRILPLKCC